MWQCPGQVDLEGVEEGEAFEVEKGLCRVVPALPRRRGRRSRVPRSDPEDLKKLETNTLALTVILMRTYRGRWRRGGSGSRLQCPVLTQQTGLPVRTLALVVILTRPFICFVADATPSPKGRAAAAKQN